MSRPIERELARATRLVRGFGSSFDEVEVAAIASDARRRLPQLFTSDGLVVWISVGQLAEVLA